MKLIILMLLVTFSGIAVAGFYNGNQLYVLSKTVDSDNERYSDTIFFDGYVMGVVDSYDGKLFNLPNGVTVGQIRSIVAKYLKNNPEYRNYPAPQLIIVAIANAFPESVIIQKHDNKQPDKAK